MGDRGGRETGLPCSTYDVASPSILLRSVGQAFQHKYPGTYGCMSNLFYTQARKLAAGHQRNYAVNTTASANTPLSLGSPSCSVPVCNGNEMFTRPVFGLDMRFGVTEVGVQQSMTRKPPIDQCHLPAAVGTASSANTPFSLRSPSYPVPVCNGNEVFARPVTSDLVTNGI